MKSSIPSTSRAHSQLADLRLRHAKSEEKPQRFRESHDEDASADIEAFSANPVQTDVFFEQAFARIDEPDAKMSAAWAAAAPQTPASAARMSDAGKSKMTPMLAEFEAVWAESKSSRQQTNVDAADKRVERGLTNEGRILRSTPAQRRDSKAPSAYDGSNPHDLAQIEVSNHSNEISRANARLMMLSNHLVGKPTPSAALQYVRDMLTEQSVTTENNETPQGMHKTILLGLGTAHEKFRARISELMGEYKLAAGDHSLEPDNDRALRINLRAVLQTCQTLEQDEKNCFQASVESFGGQAPIPDRAPINGSIGTGLDVADPKPFLFVTSDLGFMSSEGRVQHLLNKQQYYPTIYQAIVNIANKHKGDEICVTDIREADGNRLLALLGDLVFESKHKSIYVSYDLNLRHQTKFEWAQTPYWGA